MFGRYGGLPSYRAMLDREGWDTPTDAVIAGDEATVIAEIARYEAAGVTDFCAVEFGVGRDRAVAHTRCAGCCSLSERCPK